jgi:hypothetical protein
MNHPFTPPHPSQIEGGGSAARKPLTQRSSHETADDYTGVVAHLPNNLRVSICKNALQYLIQQSDGNRGGETRWKTLSYPTSKSAVIELLRRSHSLQGPILGQLLEALPERPRDYQLQTQSK